MKILVALVITASLFLSVGTVKAHDEAWWGTACESWEGPYYYWVDQGVHWHWDGWWWPHSHGYWAPYYVYHDHYYGWNCGFSP